MQVPPGDRFTRRRHCRGIGRYPGTRPHVAAALNPEGTDSRLLPDTPAAGALAPALESVRRLLGPEAVSARAGCLDRGKVRQTSSPSWNKANHRSSPITWLAAGWRGSLSRPTRASPTHKGVLEQINERLPRQLANQVGTTRVHRIIPADFSG
jgi:hypothetical protein